MTLWILAVLALFVIQSYLPSSMRYFFSDLEMKDGVASSLGGRDNPPALSIKGGRAARALNNMKEALFVFLPVALLLQIKGAPSDLAQNGALVFLVFRVMYVPAYISAIIGLRSLIWMGALAGLGMMIAALFL